MEKGLLQRYLVLVLLTNSTNSVQVMTRLLLEGHELFALDWLGHGLSDKPVQRDALTFELHIQTLIAFVNHVELDNAILVAHHWGG